MVLTLCACAPKDDQSVTEENNTAEQTSESITEATTAINADTSATGNRWIDSDRFFINGKEIRIGLEGSTMQDVADAGAYCVIWGYPVGSLVETYYTLDDDYNSNGLITTIYPNEEAAETETGGISVMISPNSTDGTLTGKIKDCFIVSFSFAASEADVWGDSLSFDFPLTITKDELIENSGEPAQDDEYGCTFMVGLGVWYFEFDENGQLKTLGRR